jgi:hypothetical protein
LKGRRRLVTSADLERLEDRTLLAVLVSYDLAGANAGTIRGTIGDQVWLRTNGGTLQYSTDATNYSDLNLDLTQDVTVTFGDMGQVHLMDTVEPGHALTFQALGASSGAGGQLASPNLFSVEGNVYTAGGNLSILNMQGIEVKSGVTIATRNIGSSTQYLSAPSVGNSGALTLTSENPDTLNPILNIDFNHPHVTLASGAHLLAQVLPTDPFTAGDITLSAQNTNDSIGSTSTAVLGLSALAREATVDLAGASVMGARIDVQSDAGDQDLLKELAQLGNGNALWASGFIANSLPWLTDMFNLPVSVLVKQADATVEVGQGTAQSFDPSQVNPSTGEITSGSATGLSTGDAVTYTSGGNAITGLTSGATYFAIVDSSTTLRLAASKDDALNDRPITGLGAGNASGAQSLSPDSQIVGSDVDLDTSARSDAEGQAVYYGQLGAGPHIPGLGANYGTGSLAFAVAIGIPTAETLVDSGSQITAEDDVGIKSDASSTTNNLSVISQNLGALNSVETALGADGTTQPRIQLAGGVGVDDLTAHSTVSRYASVEAGSDVAVTATGDITDRNTVSTASYFDGTAGVSLAFNFSSADVQAYVDGTVTAGSPSSVGLRSTAPVSLTFNPFTTVLGSNDPTEPNTLDFGTTDPGLKTGDEIVYDSGQGGAVDGLTSGGTYYVIDRSVPGHYRIQLALSLADAEAGQNAVVFPPNPTLYDTKTGVTLPFTQVSEAVPYPFDPTTDVSNNAIDFGFAHGLSTGQAVTYTSTGTPISNLTSGDTYYVIVIDPQTIELAASYAAATAPTPDAIPICGGAATGTYSIEAQTPIEFGFNVASYFNAGDPLVYTGAPGKYVDGLTSGDTYYAEPAPNNPYTLLLSGTPGGTPLPIGLSPVLKSPDGSQTYTITSIDSGSSSFLFDPALGYSFTAGEPLVYTGRPRHHDPRPDQRDGILRRRRCDQPLRPPVGRLAGRGPGGQRVRNPALHRGDAGLHAGGSRRHGGHHPVPEPPGHQPDRPHQPGPQLRGRRGGGLPPGGRQLDRRAHRRVQYFVIPVAGEPNTIQLAQTANGPAIALDPNSRLTGDDQTLDLVSADPITGTLYLASAPGSTVQTGDAFTYHEAVGNGIQGLVDGTTYYAIVLADPTTLRVAANLADAEAGKAIPLSATFTDANGNSLLIQTVDGQANTITLNAPLGTPLKAGDTITYHANGASVPGLLDGGPYSIIDDQPGGINPITFTPSQVATGGSALTLPGHGFYTGEPVTYTVAAGGTPIGGLTSDGTTPYYVIVLDSQTIELASTAANALSGQALTLSETVASGAQTLTPPEAAGSPVTFAPSPVVDPVAHTISLPSHPFATGEPVTYTVAAGATPIRGLSPGAVYYVIVVDDDTIRLADSEADAQAGSFLPVDATGAGGTQTFTPVQGSSTAVTFTAVAVSGNGDAINLPDHGYITGEAVTYATAGDPIGGLSNAGMYYVIAVDSNTVELAATADDAYAGNALPLDPQVATGDQSLTPVPAADLTVRVNPSAVRDAGGTFALPGHGFVTGEAVTYSTTGAAIQGLTSGAIYYVIVVDGNTIRLAADQADAFGGVALGVDPAGASGTQTLAPSQPVFQLDDPSMSGNGSSPAVLSLGGAIAFGTVDHTVMSGAQQTIRSSAAPGIDIQAELQSFDYANTGSGLGGNPEIENLLANSALTGQVANTLTSFRNVYAVESMTAHYQTTTVPVASELTKSISKADSFGISTSPIETRTDTSIAGSVALIVTNFHANAEVGPDAVLASAANVTVEGLITEKEQTSVQSSISKPEVPHGSTSAIQGTSVSVAAEVGVFTASATALVDPNATIDAAGTLTVHASTTYPFAFPFRDPSGESVTEKLGENPLESLTTGFLGGTLGLQTFLVNNDTRTSSGPAGAAAQNGIGVALSLSVNLYTNTAVATIGSGARINQDPAYQTPTQSVDVAAETSIDEVNITGMFDAGLSPDGFVEAIRSRTILPPAKNATFSESQHNFTQLFSLLGNSSGGYGLGVSAPITIIATTATAAIDGGALVHIGPMGSLSDTADDRNVFLVLAQSGGQARSMGSAAPCPSSW